MGLSDSLLTCLKVMSSLFSNFCQNSLPGPSVFLSVRAVSHNPGESCGCFRPLLLRRCWLHHLWQSGHSRFSVTRPSREFSRFRQYGSHVRSAHDSTGSLLLLTRFTTCLRTINMICSFQQIRLIRVIPVHQRRKERIKHKGTKAQRHKGTKGKAGSRRSAEGASL